MEKDNGCLAWPQCEGYLTVRPLDEREYTKVWLVQREVDQRYMVMKLIANDEALASMRHSGQALECENVVEFHGVVSSSLGLGLLVEYCPGGSLGRMVERRGALPLGETITALAPIAQALATLHARGIRHGDVSPNNILLTAEGMPKLSDFQEAGLVMEDAPYAGTPGFIAPEILQGNAAGAGGETDVYALGACLWFLLAAREPEQPSLRPPVTLVFEDVPELILDLLVESLHEDPLQRPSAEQFARTLFASGRAEALDWTESVPASASHLMATIHPPATTGRRRAGRTHRHAAPVSRNPIRGAKQPLPARPQKLKATPGGRTVVWSAVCGLLLVIGTGVGMAYWKASTDRQSSLAAPAPHASQPVGCSVQSDAQVPSCAQDSAAVITALLDLSSRRDAGLASSSDSQLSRIYTPGSEQLVQDLATKQKLRELGLSIEGLHTRLEQIRVIARKYPDTVVLDAESHMGEYRFTSQEDSRRVHVAKGGPGETIQFELTNHEGEWRISRVLQRESKSGTVANDDPTGGRAG